jgi:glycosyltransferase involved in cell wall biosynthesis
VTPSSGAGGPLVSVVTATWNSERTVGDTLASVAAQTHPHVEHIVVDGASSDRTMTIVRELGTRVARVVSEPDRGVYDALNKGIRLAGGDVVGLLHSDDRYAAPDVLERVAAAFRDDPGLSGVYADVEFVRPDDDTRVVRRYSSRRFRPSLLAWGWMPAHPTLFLRREVCVRIGDYRTDFRIASDFEYTIRLFREPGLRFRYIDDVLVRMRTGGLSTRGLASTRTINAEILRACREHGIRTSLPRLYARYAVKAFELAGRIGRR